MWKSHDAIRRPCAVDVANRAVDSADNVRYALETDAAERFLHFWNQVKVTGTEVRGVRWVVQHLPTPASQQLLHNIGNMRSRVVVQKDGRISQQVRPLLPQSWSQIVFQEVCVILRSDGRVSWYRMCKDDTITVVDKNHHNLHAAGGRAKLGLAR